MKSIGMKLCSGIFALSLLLTGCGNRGGDVLGDGGVTDPIGSAGSTGSVTTTSADTSDYTTGDATASSGNGGSTSATSIGSKVSVTKPGPTANNTSSGTSSGTSSTKGKHNHTLTEKELYDKLLGGWIGQMAGVAPPISSASAS